MKGRSMPTTEARLTEPDRLEEALALDVDAVSIGQEGCLTKLPDTETLRDTAARIRAAGREAVVVAPIAWPRTATILMERLRAVIADGPTTVVANDIGTLLALAGEGGARLVVGLGLTRARPDSAERGEAPPPPRPIADRALLRVLERHGVTAVEVDTHTDTAAIDGHWQVRQLVDVLPVGYGRSCPTARHHQTGPPDCRHLCDQPLTVAPHQRWQLSHGHREPLPTGTPREALTVWGNTVYQLSEAEPEADHLIVDIRWHPPGQLAARVQALQLDPVTTRI
jgi:hypothetical protein